MMAAKHQTASELSDEPPCLQGEVLTLMEIINIARGVEPETYFKKSDLPDLWWRRYRDILQRVELDEIPSVKIYDTPKLRRVALRHLAPFADTLDDNWQWLKDLCDRWANARGDNLHTLVSSASAEKAKPIATAELERMAKEYYKSQRQQLDAGKLNRPPSRKDDRQWAKNANIPVNLMDKFRKAHAPEDWHQTGPRRKKPNPK
jgi:hypothetical protein